MKRIKFYDKIYKIGYSDAYSEIFFHRSDLGDIYVTKEGKLLIEEGTSKEILKENN